jgi:23S rRNA U2552 (ribose-2'-O)-methylase RlmE/FtsJ
MKIFKGEAVDLVVSDGAPDILGEHDFDHYV